MRHLVFAVVVLATAAAWASEVPLRQRVVSASPLAGADVITGRAQCGASTWLLTDAPALVEVRVAERSVVSKNVRGLARDEHPWGLACVGVGELWTLVDHRTLARLSTSAEVTLRTKLRQPLLNVFGLGDKLVLQRQPGPAGSPLLAAARPVDVNRAEPWPGPVAARQSSSKLDVPSALVACGLAYQALLPCWISNQTRIIVSDGTRVRTSSVQPRFMTSTAVDPSVPLWDVAVAPSSVVWILTSAVAGEERRRVGARLTRSNFRGDDLGAVDLVPRARVILSAAEQRAVVLTTAGTLVEVSAP
jgi:hypothetical protein